MQDFGPNVRWRRKALGMSQAELAAKIRRRHRPTTASYISRIESGEIDPRVSTVASLARALRCKPWHLVTPGHDQPFFDYYQGLTAQQKRDVQAMMRGFNGRR